MKKKSKKIKSKAELKKILAQMKKRGKKVVFTNGCFDLLHFGHIYCFQKAKECGDILVVALNTDQSVRRLKGKGRPLLKHNARADLIAAIRCVDFVTFFREDTPLEIIKELRPDILVKGGDYRKDQVVGRRVVESYGGRVVIVKRIPGYSTTKMIKLKRKVSGG